MSAKHNVELPKEWHVIGPVERNLPLTADILRHIPKSLKISGKSVTKKNFCL